MQGFMPSRGLQNLPKFPSEGHGTLFFLQLIGPKEQQFIRAGISKVLFLMQKNGSLLS